MREEASLNFIVCLSSIEEKRFSHDLLFGIIVRVAPQSPRNTGENSGVGPEGAG